MHSHPKLLKFLFPMLIAIILSVTLGLTPKSSLINSEEFLEVNIYKYREEDLLIVNEVEEVQTEKVANKIKFHEDPDRMEEEIRHHVPIGSSIADAKTVMEQNGFKCEYIQNGTYSEVRNSEDAPGGTRQTVHRNVDFLYCDCSKSTGMFVSRRWQVSIEHQDENVKSVSVSIGSVGS